MPIKVNYFDNPNFSYNLKSPTRKEALMERLLRQNLVSRIEFSGHQIDVEADAERGQDFVEAVDGADGSRVFVFG